MNYFDPVNGEIRTWWRSGQGSEFPFSSKGNQIRKIIHPKSQGSDYNSGKRDEIRYFKKNSNSSVASNSKLNLKGYAEYNLSPFIQVYQCVLFVDSPNSHVHL
jgi:hypothetical protein